MIDTSYVCPRCKGLHNLPDESFDGHRTTCLCCNFPFVLRVERTVTVEAECVTHVWGEWITGWDESVRFCTLCSKRESRDKEPVP